MGNCGKKVKNNITNFIKFKRNGNSKLKQATHCPKCNQLFGPQTTYNTFNSHLDFCLVNNNNNIITSNEVTVTGHATISQEVPSSNEYNIWIKIRANETFDISQDNFKWVRKSIDPKKINNHIKNLDHNEAKKLSFEEKQIWFRHHLEKKRIHWTKGSDKIIITKENIVNDSIVFVNNVDLYKEVKIQIDNEKVNDAGGLMREWIHILMKELFSKKINVFQRCPTKEIYYTFNPQCEINEYNINIIKLTGKIIAKAIFERIPINICFNRPLIKYILQREVTLDDIACFDQDLYQSWKYLLENDIECSEIFDQCFSITKIYNGQICEMDLKPRGSQIRLKNDNKQEYVDLCIKMYTYSQIEIFLELLLEDFYNVIPQELISVFDVEEFEMIINGLPFINSEDWEQNTVYKGAYHKNHQVIRWFWQLLKEFNQQQLSKFLQYCTGSSRTPVEGFKFLESNRGNYSQFCIESSKYSVDNSFPRAHTCFNRLDLPMYQDLPTLKKYIYCIIQNDLEGQFGLD